MVSSSSCCSSLTPCRNTRAQCVHSECHKLTFVLLSQRGCHLEEHARTLPTVFCRMSCQFSVGISTTEDPGNVPICTNVAASMAFGCLFSTSCIIPEVRVLQISPILSLVSVPGSYTTQTARTCHITSNNSPHLSSATSVEDGYLAGRYVTYRRSTTWLTS